MYQKIITILETADTNKYKRFLYLLFLPITSLFEYYCFKHFNTIIFTELSNDDFIEFLDKNEFGYKNNQLIKMDVIDSEYHISLKPDILRNSIRNELNNAFIQKIRTTTNINVEEILSITVDVFQENSGVKHYKACVQYFRYYVVLENKKYLKYWSVYFVILLCAYLLFFKLI